jgi:hypothetical protein
MKAITPAKLIPPDHSTAASGTLPTEQTKLSDRDDRSDDRVLEELRGGRGVADEQRVEEAVWSWPTNPASRNPIVISFHSIDQSLRKLCATSDHACADTRETLADRECAPALWCWWPLVGLLGVHAGLLLQARDTNRRSSSVMITISTIRRRTRPA